MTKHVRVFSMESVPTLRFRRKVEGEDVAARKTVFFCGIGGSGMSALAQVLRHHGHAVRGSDRSRDQGQNHRLFEQLESWGIALYPQDGSGVDDTVDELVVSAAVEEDIPDVRAALREEKPVRKRAEVLAELFNRAAGVAVGGTSGKTTVAGMIGHVLRRTGRDPTVILGGALLNESPSLTGNAICGSPDLSVIEADESDGTIVLYEPSISVLTNISRDHKPLEVLIGMFREFVQKARRAAVINMDCEASVALGVDGIGFGVENDRAQVCAQKVQPLADGVAFEIEGVGFRMLIPGRHNISNAAAAVAACSLLGITTGQSADALADFAGIRRRLQVLGTAGGVTVIDDFAHNPDKISASLATLREQQGRLLVMFQPTGFAPTRFLKDGLIAALSDGLEKHDLLAMPEIYYAGGTAVRDISSEDLIDAICEHGIRAAFFQERKEIARWFLEQARPGDRVVIMGARDDTLTDFAAGILKSFAT